MTDSKTVKNRPWDSESVHKNQVLFGGKGWEGWEC